MVLYQIYEHYSYLIDLYNELATHKQLQHCWTECIRLCINQLELRALELFSVGYSFSFFDIKARKQTSWNQTNFIGLLHKLRPAVKCANYLSADMASEWMRVLEGTGEHWSDRDLVADLFLQGRPCNTVHMLCSDALVARCRFQLSVPDAGFKIIIALRPSKLKTYSSWW